MEAFCCEVLLTHDQSFKHTWPRYLMCEENYKHVNGKTIKMTE